MGTKPHKHAEYIQAWLDGDIVQYQYSSWDAGIWHTVDKATDFDAGVMFRIKPKEKQKVKMWQWVYAEHITNIIKISDGFFTNEEDAQDLLGTDNVIQRADWTEIEVEVEDE